MISCRRAGKREKYNWPLMNADFELRLSAAGAIFQPALIVLPQGRIERAAAAKIDGPTVWSTVTF
jgi:hypothetical protein